MSTNKVLGLLVFIMIIAAPFFQYIAYTAAFFSFVLLLRADAKGVASVIREQRSIVYICTAIGLSTIFAIAPWHSMLTGVLVILHLIAYIAIIRYINKDNIEHIFKLLNIIGIVICIYGVYQYITGNLNVDKSWTDESSYGSLLRVYSTLRNPNIFAAYLTFNISFAVSYLLKKQTDAYTTINLVLSSLCLIWTYSRGGFIAFAAAMLFIAIFCKQPKVGIYLSAMMLLSFGLNTLQHNDRSSISKLASDSSSMYRIEIWKASWDLFKSNFVFGGGLGSVPKQLSYSSTTLKGYIFHSHNMLLHIMTETGIFGLSIFIAMIISGYKSFFTFWKSYGQSNHSYIAMGFAASLTAMLVHGMVDCPVMIPSRSLVFLIYIALFPALYAKLCYSSKKPATLDSEYWISDEG